MNIIDTIKQIHVGDQWRQVTRVVVDGEERELVRVIEVTRRPTLSRPVVYRVVRNDAHPHRVGRTGAIKRSDLRRKYEAVSA